MIFPPVEPWTEFTSTDFLDSVLESRGRNAGLTELAQEGDDASLEQWVRVHWTMRGAYCDSRHLPQPGAALARAFPEPLDYSRVVHNRELEGDEHVRRVANIVRGLLTNPFVDEFARGDVYLLEGPGLDEVWRGRLGHGGPVPWRWSVEAGNHRIVAQHLIGVGPYAFVRDVHHWE